jgi:hypothetical protein
MILNTLAPYVDEDSEVVVDSTTVKEEFLYPK